MIRTKRLGDLGELWTERLLKQSGFESVRDLNVLRNNHAGGDFLAERHGTLYFISVKARNKYQQGSSRLNGGYNIFPQKVRTAALEYDAVPAWLTIQVDTSSQRFSAYFGTIDSLRNPNAVAVPMTPAAVSGYECLVKDAFDKAITPELSNQLIEPAEARLEAQDPTVRPSATAREDRGNVQPAIQTAKSHEGQLADFDRISLQLGYSPGTKTQRAVALYLRPEGATTAEVTAINGGPYLNCLKELEAKGHSVRRSTVIGPSGRSVTAYKIELRGTNGASLSGPRQLEQQMGDRRSKPVPSPRGQRRLPEKAFLSANDLRAVEHFVGRTIANQRSLTSRSDTKGVASGSVFNLLRLHDPALARKVGGRSELVRLAGEMGFAIYAYPSGLGLRGSGIRETIDLKDT